ncbi:hypothetical protein [Mucilaginibacter sp. CSA2-8R]|uniref:hypothetical protein n=1 Tax=Mucilaginibacter sp. CSA2-8R TaxID=3141542 RepID=UPI00315DF4D8
MVYVTIPDLGYISTNDNERKQECILVQHYVNDSTHNEQLDKYVAELATVSTNQYQNYEVIFIKESSVINQNSLKKYHGLDVDFINQLNSSIFRKYKYHQGQLISIKQKKNAADLL